MRKPYFHLVSAEESVATSPLYLPLPSRACIPHRPQLSSNPPPRQNCRPPPCALSRHLQPAPRQSASSSVNTTTAPKTTAVQPAAWLAGVCLSPHKCRGLPLPPPPPHPHVSNRLPVCLGAAASRQLSGGVVPVVRVGLLRTESGRRQHNATGEAKDRIDGWTRAVDSMLAPAEECRRLPLTTLTCSVRLSPSPQDQHRPLCLPQRPREIYRVSALASRNLPNPTRCRPSPVCIYRLHHDLLRTEPPEPCLSPVISASVNRLLASLKPGWRAILARPPVRTQPKVVASAIYLRTSQLLLLSTHYQLPHIPEGRHMVDRVADLNATFPLLNVAPHLETTPNPNARSTGLVTVRLPRITTYALDRAAQQQQQLVA